MEDKYWVNSLASVLQRLDIGIQWINHYPVNTYYQIMLLSNGCNTIYPPFNRTNNNCLSQIEPWKAEI